MAVTPDAEPATNARLNQIRDSYERDISASIENVRWLTTLVLAAMAGIAAYRTSGGTSPGLGPAYAILLVLFGLSLAAFVLSIIRARYERADFSERFNGIVVDVTDALAALATNDKKAPADGTKELVQFRELRITALPSSFKFSAFLELFGLGLLALSATLAALMVFFTELVESLF